MAIRHHHWCLILFTICYYVIGSSLWLPSLENHKMYHLIWVLRPALPLLASRLTWLAGSCLTFNPHKTLQLLHMCIHYAQEPFNPFLIVDRKKGRLFFKMPHHQENWHLCSIWLCCKGVTWQKQRCICWKGFVYLLGGLCVCLFFWGSVSKLGFLLAVLMFCDCSSRIKRNPGLWKETTRHCSQKQKDEK